MTKSLGIGRGGKRNGAGRPPGLHHPWSKETTDRFRSLIQTDKIIQRLNDCATGEQPMTREAITAALGLLRKVVPDVASVEHSGEIVTSKVIRAPSIAETLDQWEKEHVPQEFKHATH